MEKFGIGQAVRRREDARLLTGEGEFVDDVALPGLVHAVVVRSPYAHARILSIDVSDAAAAAGALRVLTIDDWKAAGLGTIPSRTEIDGIDQETLRHPARYPLADGAVKYVGEPVAFVVASSLAEARAAADLVTVDYDELPSNVDTGSALADGVAQIWPEHDTNRAFRFTKGDKAAVDAVFASAPRVVSLDLVNNRVAPSAIETRGSIGEFDSATGRYTLRLSGQAVHANKTQMAIAVFRTEPDRIRVVAGDVGGGFGAKNFVYPENVLVMFAARLVGAPVKWIAERGETFFAEVHGRDHVSKAELALDADGRFLGLRVSTLANMGAYLSSMAPVIPTSASWVSMGGAYDIPAVYMEVDAVYTNTVPVDAYRGAGRPESAYLIERLVDVAAHDIGCDPAELRAKNFVRTFPYATSLGMDIDCGDFDGTRLQAARAAVLESAAERRRDAAGRGLLRGVGTSSYLEVTLGLPSDGSEIRFDDNGKVALLVGTQSTGQGHETAYSQIVHEELGIPFEDISLVQGDTDLVASGGGHGGSRSLMIGGSAMVGACGEVRDKGLAAAAHILEADRQDIDFEDGLFAVRGTNRRIGLQELECALREAEDLPQDVEPTLGSSATFERTRHSFPNGCHVAEVEIDPDTGAVRLAGYWVVDDFGRILNPLIAAGQVYGGTVQGIGQAMLEQIVYDSSGQLLTGSLMDYALPRADDLPDMHVAFNQSAPTDTNPLGVKGAGEAGATGAPAAVANAVMDALREYDVRHLQMPFTPEKVWRAIRAARS